MQGLDGTAVPSEGMAQPIRMLGRRARGPKTSTPAAHGSVCLAPPLPEPWGPQVAGTGGDWGHVRALVAPAKLRKPDASG